MKTSLADLITASMDKVGDTLTSETATGGSATTLVDTSRTEADDDWNNAWLYISDTTDEAAPEGEERRVTDFVAGTDTLTVFPAFTAVVGNGDTYELREIFSRDHYVKAIQHAIRMAREWWAEIKWTYPVAGEAEIGSVTSATANSITNSSATWTVDALIGRKVTIYAGTGKGQERFILDNDATSLTVPLWETTPDATSGYRIEKTGAAHIVICSQQLDYPLPPGCKAVYEAWIELPDTEESGTATATTATTLTDSGQSWTASEHIGRYIVIYDGLGAGQTRLITGNTATQVTVPTWAITPDTTSKYKIKNATEPTSDVFTQDIPWVRIYHARPDIDGGYMRFPTQHTEGAWVRLKYETDPSDVSADADTTDVPEDYILYKAAALLWEKKVGKVADAQWLMGWNNQQAEAYSVMQRKRRPHGTIWQWDDIATVHTFDSPFRPTR